MIYIDGNELNVARFPNNEIKIKRPWVSHRTVNVQLKWQSDEDFMHLYFLKKHLDQYRSLFKGVCLEIFYMPYSRMDRAMGGDIFTLKSACEFINELNFDEVTIHEPHSDVTPALIDRCVVVNTSLKLLKTVVWGLSYLCFPDAGAAKRYHLDGYKELIGSKRRDPDTGQITGLELSGDEYLEGKNVCIIDDLSSSGGTFVRAAEELKSRCCGDIYLIVAHAEENILKGKVFDGNIKKVLTTNSMIDISKASSQLEIIDITTL
ncbi:MAG: ribose-phosphate pyrophosphokinase [Desulfobulbaceae bacterium]|nr:ribose-phosphate pyrophosphokinase [Desulfobulbaceae bacterium]